MSWLTLVRHGQASFFAEDYDQLSPLGQTQARLLGEHWCRRGVVFGEVYTGPRARQRQTAEVVGACYRRAGLPWPEPAMLAELDEYDFGGLLQRLAPALAAQDPGFSDLVEGYRRSVGEAEQGRAFQRMFEALTLHWLAGLSALEGLESWLAFRDRVRRGLEHIRTRPGSGRRVAAFTSGGFIGTTVQHALAAPDRSALEVNWRLRNCSLTELVFSRHRLTLDSFNTVPHLEDAELWTYR
jgi:broad specificity phosphatase PhoE